MPPTSAYRVTTDPFTDLSGAAEAVADLVLRTDLTRPGFAVLDLGRATTPRAFRALLVDLGTALDAVSRRRFGSRLVLISANRFDQQRTTEAHLDGGPDESLLVLGYEPTEVKSRLFFVDYSRAAADRGATPKDFLAAVNPMARPVPGILEPYTTEIEACPPGHYRIVVINNSACDLRDGRRGMLGVLHKATVDARPDRERVVNSLMLRAADADDPTPTLPADVARFVEDGAFVAG